MRKSYPKIQHEKSKTTIKRIFSIKEDSADSSEIRDRLLAGGQVSGTNMIVLICAILIASVGLNTGSTAVIIGAMLISPIMGSILAMSYGTASADLQLTKKHLIGFLFQIGASVLTSCIFFMLSPIKEASSELLARTTPSVFDLVIATAGGIAGIVGQTRKDRSNTVIPGVAIATALLPPLCTCGYAIANGEWLMLRGAFYLFIINSYFIFFSGIIVLSVLEIPKTKELTPKQWKRMRAAMARNAIIVALPAILMAIPYVIEF